MLFFDPPRVHRLQRRAGVPLFDRRAFAVIVTVLLVAAALWLTWAARRVLFAFLLAVFFAYLLEPVVAWLQARMRGSRGRAIVVTYLALALLLGGGMVFAVPQLLLEGSAAMQTLPRIAADVNSGQIAQTIGRQHGWDFETRTGIQRWIGAHRDAIAAGAQDVARRAAELSANALWIVLIPILSLFFLKDKGCFGQAVLGLVRNDSSRAFWRVVIDDLDRMLAQYIRAQLMLCGASVIAYCVFLAAVRFPYALGLGVVAGLLEFIPFVGPAITAVILFAIGFFGGYPHWVLVMLFVGAWRLVQDYVNTPYIMGEGLELHPLAAIFGILIGGEVAGIAGMFLSIPVIAGLRILWRNWQMESL